MKKIFVLFLIAILGGFAYYCFYPDLGKLKKENPRKTALMEIREAEWKEKERRLSVRQKWVALPRISPYVVKAVLIAEDDKFWSHSGFDLDAMQKAMEKDLKAKKLRFGGSTISQQLVKNLYLSPSKNPLRKLKEAVITWRLEKTVSKRRILEIYLNVAEWGDGIFGIQAAAERYYGKSASALGPRQAARLAAVLPNPRKYRADTDSRYVDRRAGLIYTIMVKRGIVTPEFEEITEAATPAEETPQPEPREITSPTADATRAN